MVNVTVCIQDMNTSDLYYVHISYGNECWDLLQTVESNFIVSLSLSFLSNSYAGPYTREPVNPVQMTRNIICDEAGHNEKKEMENTEKQTCFLLK